MYISRIHGVFENANLFFFEYLHQKLGIILNFGKMKIGLFLMKLL